LICNQVQLQQPIPTATGRVALHFILRYILLLNLVNRNDLSFREFIFACIYLDLS